MASINNKLNRHINKYFTVNHSKNLINTYSSSVEGIFLARLNQSTIVKHLCVICNKDLLDQLEEDQFTSNKITIITSTFIRKRNQF